MQRFALIFVALFIGAAFAECVSVDNITKCARLPDSDDWWYVNVSGRLYGDDGIAWSVVYKADIVVSGTATGDLMDEVYCVINYPFNGSFVVAADPGVMMLDSLGQACAYEAGLPSRFQVSAIDGDVCPDGFYTVPYDVSCGEGMVEVGDVPSCGGDVGGDYCLMSSVVPCAGDFSRIRTSTGLVFSLWAEKYTEPALCVKYNDTVCYGNLVSGNGANSININYNGQVYHLTD